MNEAILIQHQERLYITGRAEIVSPENLDMASWTAESIAGFNENLMWVAGKFVEANKPNLNKQYWSRDDLEFAQSTIRYTPMNMLHQIQNPIGVYTEARFVDETSSENAHITALGCLWAHRFPNEAALVEMANANGSLFYSMECIGKKLHCKGGCEREFSYFSRPEDLCSHLRDRTAVRHIVEPTFTGGAIIIPPTKPAWPNADVELLASLTTEYATKMDDVVDHVSDELKVSPSQGVALLNLLAGYAKRN